MKNPFKDMSIAGKAFVVLLLLAAVYFGNVAYKKVFPKKVKKAEITTKATSLPPLSYDKNSNAALRKTPQFNEPADVQGPQIRGAILAWNGFSAANYAVGGTTTSIGSLCQELGLNVSLAVQNSCTEQANQLYAFAQELHRGDPNPTKGVHIVNWMGDGVPNYITGLNERITKDFGPEYACKVITFSGASFGEDKWMLKPKYAKDARGSLTATVIRDGDWNEAVIKSQLMGWPLNHDLGTYDKTKINFVAAPNDDYIEAGKMYNTGVKVTLRLVENGKYTGRDTTLAVTGVASWFPVDQQLVQGRGGLVTVASTKEFGSQMACAIIINSKWANDNRTLVEKLVEAIGKGGDQIKSHDQALQFACQVNEAVFADKEKTATDWYNAFKSFDLTDEDGNVVNIGGSRAFNLADAATYTGVAGGSDKYKQVYNTFGSICVEAYPEVLSRYWPYEDAVDWSYLRAVYNRNKSAGTAGNVSKVDFTTSQKGAIVGDANYSIEFNLNSAVIKPESYPVLDKILGQLNVADNTFVDIGGHTDVTGDDAHNMELSNLRASSVRQYLIQRDPDLTQRLTSKGYGETMLLPLYPPNDPRNRRVEIKLYKTK